MDATRLVEGYKTILWTIYSPPVYYRRALDCLKHVMMNKPSVTTSAS